MQKLEETVRKRLAAAEKKKKEQAKKRANEDFKQESDDEDDELIKNSLFQDPVAEQMELISNVIQFDFRTEITWKFHCKGYQNAIITSTGLIKTSD